MKKLFVLFLLLVTVCVLFAACGGGNDANGGTENKGPCTHENMQWTTLKEATCLDAGVKEGSCPDCKRGFTEEIPATGHQIENGVCSACNRTFIGSYDDLVAFAASVEGGNGYLNKFVELTADINLNNEEWTPIGTTSEFQGTFLGNGHIISGLKISQNYTYAGLFATIAPYTAIRDLTVIGSITTNSPYAGLVAGKCEGTAIKCAAIGNIVMTENNEAGKIGANAGGVFGQAGYVSECYSDVEISVTRASVGDTSVGGVVGSALGNVQCSYFTGSIDVAVSSSFFADVCVGGIVGQCNGGTNNYTTITECYSTGRVAVSSNSGSASYVGGILGYSDTNTKISKCFVISYISLTNASPFYSSYGGRIAGKSGGSNAYEHCYYSNSTSYPPLEASNVNNGGEKAENEAMMKSASWQKGKAGFNEATWVLEDEKLPELKPYKAN